MMLNNIRERERGIKREREINFLYNNNNII
jgi:hypothetical protein